MTVEMLTVRDVSRITTLSEYTVRAAVRDGDLVASKLRGRILVHPDDLATWIDNGKLRAAAGLPANARPTAKAKKKAPAGGYRDLFRRQGEAA